MLKCKILHHWSLNRKRISLVLFQQVEARVNNEIIFSFDYDIRFGLRKGWPFKKTNLGNIILLWWNNREEIGLEAALAMFKITVFSSLDHTLLMMRAL